MGSDGREGSKPVDCLRRRSASKKRVSLGVCDGGERRRVRSRSLERVRWRTPKLRRLWILGGLPIRSGQLEVRLDFGGGVILQLSRN